MPGYGLDSVFAESRLVFESIVVELADPVRAEETHDRLEEYLTERGRELMRRLFQDHADLRQARERRVCGVIGGDDVERTRVECGRVRVLTTVFGQVAVGRLAYRAVGSGNLFPADGRWNLPAGRHSHGLARLVALESVRGSFESARAAIVRATGVTVGKRQLEQMAVSAAADITDFYAGTRPEPCEESMLLLLTADAKGVVMRPDALREATAKAAAASSPKLTTRLSPGEKRNRKRMAELVCVYDAKPVIRTPADVIVPQGVERDPKRERGPKATGKWLTGSVTDDVPAVIKEMFDEASRRDPGGKRTWVVLVDGNCHQIDTINAEAAQRNQPAHLVIDFIHVAEYVWKAAWSFYDKGDPDAEAWVADQLTKILTGKAKQVAAGIRRRATTFGYRKSERAGADECAGYLTSKANYLAYDQALAAGWPIATGVIEGACRHLVKDRLDITGARWSLPGAEAILRLRALISSGDFDAYWQFHLSREHDRNHHDRYQQHQTSYALTA